MKKTPFTLFGARIENPQAAEKILDGKKSGPLSTVGLSLVKIIDGSFGNDEYLIGYVLFLPIPGVTGYRSDTIPDLMQAGKEFLGEVTDSPELMTLCPGRIELRIFHCDLPTRGFKSTLLK